jgi:hypothetical protein
MRVILHIGPPKTGSTTLQATLIAMAPELARHGIAFPTTWREFDAHNHFGIVAQLHRPSAEDLRADWQRVRESGARTVILSCEALFGEPPDALRVLRETLTGAAWEIVFVLRRWSDLLPSLWNQEVRGGATIAFPDQARVFLGEARDNMHVNHTLAWRNWADVFGRDALRIVPLDHLRRAGIGVARHFVEAILRPEAPLAVPAVDDRNVAGSAEETETLRALNWLRRQRTGRAGEQIYDRVRKETTGIDWAPLHALMRPHRRSTAVRDDDPRLQPIWEAMQAWRDRIPEIGAADEMMPRGVREVADIAPGWLAHPEAIRRLTEAYLALRGDAMPAPRTIAERYERVRTGVQPPAWATQPGLAPGARSA